MIVPAFEWDEAKRQSNLAKHGLDFVDAQAIFDGRPRLDVVAAYEAERRRLSIGQLGNLLVVVVWTVRDFGVCRIISVRRARDGEKRQYRALCG